jgi:predicted metal-binding membrane protein
MVQDLANIVLYRRTLWPREQAFLCASCLLFLASAAASIYLCVHMSGAMPMPGGWIMSMAWMRMPGQGWFGAAATFMGMWAVMMVAMMLPSLMPQLLSYRRSLRISGDTHLGLPTAIAGAGYFFVWIAFGAVAYSVGLAVTAIEMRWPALAQFAPIAIGGVLLLAGSVQLTAWKFRELTHCRNARVSRSPSPDAWKYGLRLGWHCSLCCLGFMTILLVTGVMSLGFMALVTTAITIERFALWPERAARVAGIVVLAVGILVVVRALRGA